MRILAINSKSVDAVATKLRKFGKPFSVDTVPDWRLPYDCVIGQLDEEMWSTVKDRATTVVFEFPDPTLAERIQSDYTCVKNGRILSVLIHFGKTTEHIDLERRYSCVHRTPEPVRTAGCSPCQALTGQPTVPIFRCSLFDCECSVASREIPGQGKVNPESGRRSPRAKPCTVCSERVPTTQ